VGEDLADRRPLQDRRDDLQLPGTAARAAPQVDVEDGADTLRALGRDGTPDAALMPIFEHRKPSIFAVASRAFNAGVRGDPIDLPRGLFRDL
jgi:hypothetical protein